jgi:hypothetical protein
MHTEYLEVIVFVGMISLVLGCHDVNRNRQSTSYHFDKIEEFSKYKMEFNIDSVRKLNFDSGKGSLLDFYEGPCEFKYDKSTIVQVDHYNMDFTDSSNTSIDIIEFNSEQYAASVAKELDPFVKAVRKLKGDKKNSRFCPSDYLSRVYNFVLVGNKLYLFGFDAYNIVTSAVTPYKLRHIDKVCDALRPVALSK